MKCVDVDSIQSLSEAAAVNRWLSFSLYRLPSKEIKQTEAIYFFSSRCKTPAELMQRIDELRLIPVGKGACGASLHGILRKMISDIDKVSTKINFRASEKGRFRSQKHWIVTNRELNELDALNIKPIPTKVLPLTIGGLDGN